MCGWIGICISYLFIEITRYYTDYNFTPVRKIVNVKNSLFRLVKLVRQPTLSLVFLWVWKAQGFLYL
jgi:hypothetical protein